MKTRNAGNRQKRKKVALFGQHWSNQFQQSLSVVMALQQ